MFWKTIWGNPVHWKPLIDAHGLNANAYAEDGHQESIQVLQRLKTTNKIEALDIQSVKNTADVVKIIGTILRTAKRDVERWGGKLYFAPIWGAAQ